MGAVAKQTTTKPPLSVIMWSSSTKLLKQVCAEVLTTFDITGLNAGAPLVLIPGFNLIPPFLFFLTLHISYNWFRGPHHSFQAWWDKATSRSSSDGPHPPSESPPRTAFLIVGLGFLVVFNILFIADIERTLRRNKGDGNGDAEWGFGQVLALLLLVIPLRDAWDYAWGALKEIRENRKGSQRQFEELLLRECQATSSVKEFKRLINQEANVNVWTADRRFGSTLQLVAYYGKTELVEFLLNEPDVIRDKADGGYGTPLQAGSARGHVAVVKILLGNEKSKGGLNTVGGRYGTALCAACANGNIEVVHHLLQAGADLEVDGEHFGTPLHVAVLMGSMEMAKLVLDHNQNDANRDWKDFGNAADLAVAVKNEELTALLEGRGVTRAVSAAASVALAEG
ncbi:ankyrin repeat-containing domain protein [Mycena vulgaris]|nr:ankyrin repeat-containing domain protein [Mycena vulgaris]